MAALTVVLSWLPNVDFYLTNRLRNNSLTIKTTTAKYDLKKEKEKKKKEKNPLMLLWFGSPLDS